MKPQSLFLVLCFFVMAALSSQCDVKKDDPVEPAPISSCDTCTLPSSCARYACTTRPPLCRTCPISGCDTCTLPSSCARYACATRPINCPACTTATACTVSSEFKGSIKRLSGAAEPFTTSDASAYIYTATQGNMKTKRVLVVTAQNRDASNKINETFTFSLELSAATGGNYTIVSTNPNNTFAYMTKTGRIYNGSGTTIVLNNVNAIDNTISGTIISSAMVCKIKDNSTIPIEISNVSFKICVKNALPTLPISATNLFEMPTFDGVATANWKATSIKTHFGEGNAVGKLVVEAEAGTKRFAIQIPINALSSTANATYLFPDDASPGLAIVEDVYASYNDGISTADYTSFYNGTAGAPKKGSQIGLITHDKENRTLKIDNIYLQLSKGNTTFKVFKGKLNVKY